MTPQQIVGLAARLFAICPEGNQSNTWPSLCPLILMCCVGFGGALLLWLFPIGIAHKLVPQTKFQDTLRLPAQQMMTVACVVLGLFIIVLRARPPVSVYLVKVVIGIANGQPIFIMALTTQVAVLVGFVQFAVGLFLLVKARRLAAKVMLASNTPGG